MGSKVISIRLPKDLVNRMRRFEINWSEEIRKFIEERVKSYELLESIQEIKSRARKRRVSIDSTILIREDRDSR
ncbi:MAG TPA: hypothetical protein EYH44_04730 [Thermoprotei archaeon]|nr:hypothetical protein [Thermoprotei archaeon]